MEQTVVNGLLGAGVIGALLAGIIALVQQRHSFDHERRTRFIELRRQRYADLLAAGDSWLWEIEGQRNAAKRILSGAATASELPALSDPNAARVFALSTEAQLLAREPHVSAAAFNLAQAVGLFRHHVVDPNALDSVKRDADYLQTVKDFEAARQAFFDAAKAELQKV